MNLVERLVQALTAREFRAGPRPESRTRELVGRVVADRVERGEPIALLHFWGGCKNPNLPRASADECEEASLRRLQSLHQAVSGLYGPGLAVHILVGDERVGFANGVPRERLRIYAASLESLAARLGRPFDVVRLSDLVRRRAGAFRTSLETAERTWAGIVSGQSDFDRLAANARKNIFAAAGIDEGRLAEMSREAARRYILCRVAEEEAGLYSDYAGCLRSSFIRYAQFYARYIDVPRTVPRLDAALVFYSGGKGNVTQPWQAVARRIDGRLTFLTQERLRAADRGSHSGEAPAEGAGIFREGA